MNLAKIVDFDLLFGNIVKNCENFDFWAQIGHAHFWAPRHYGNSNPKGHSLNFAPREKIKYVLKSQELGEK